jgi:hypothetical protein
MYKLSITHCKQGPDFYPLNSNLIILTLDTTFNRSVPCIHSVYPNSDPNKHIYW